MKSNDESSSGVASRRDMMALGALLSVGAAIGASSGDALAAEPRKRLWKPTFEDWYGVAALLQSCADMLDRHDFAGHAKNYTPNASFDHRVDHVYHGRAQIEEELRKILRNRRSQIFLGTPVVSRVDSNTVHSMTYFRSKHQSTAPADQLIGIPTNYGRYVDVIAFRQGSDNPLIAQRTVIKHLSENGGDLSHIVQRMLPWAEPDSTLPR